MHSNSCLLHLSTVIDLLCRLFQNFSPLQPSCFPIVNQFWLQISLLFKILVPSSFVSSSTSFLISLWTDCRSPTCPHRQYFVHHGSWISLPFRHHGLGLFSFPIRVIPCVALLNFLFHWSPLLFPLVQVISSVNVSCNADAISIYWLLCTTESKFRFPSVNSVPQLAAGPVYGSVPWKSNSESELYTRI